MNAYRLVVAIDLTADSLKDAYAQLRKLMEHHATGWETSDEWYDLCRHGEGAGNPADLQAAIEPSLETHLDKGPRETGALCGSTYGHTTPDADDVTCADCDRLHEEWNKE